jgi:hypothetical protein
MNRIHRAGPALSPWAPREGLLEAYKKHVEELRGIEDRQSKTVALLLGVFSAAGTALAKGGLGRHIGPKIFLSLMALAIVFVGQHAISELHDMRIAARDLLVRCEISLGFYELGAFLKGRMLYTKYELEYPTRGAWMTQYYWIVWVVCAGFIGMLFFGKLG